MVAINKKFPTLPDGTVDIPAWLEYLSIASPFDNIDLITKTILLADKTSKGLTTFYGQPCIEQSLELAEITIDLKLDEEAVAASILIPTIMHTQLSIDTIKETINEPVAKLVMGVQQMDTLNILLPNIKKSRNEIQIDRLRKTYLAMISDIRVALIKLALQLSLMRGIKHINPAERKLFGQETLDIYAPLANRLGIGQIKWELEDLAFHYTDPQTYKTIAKFLAERRIDREQRIHSFIQEVKTILSLHGIKANITGRAKHILSIYLKTQKKDVDYKNIYDASAIRILVPTIDDCYNVLSIVHHTWDHINEEYDDYIANPKPNGYSSIHTAVIGPDGKHFEIQIRTYDMHAKAEHGVASHWVYKESKKDHGEYESKITFLRQLLSFHKQVAEKNPNETKALNAVFNERVYVFTPAGDIVDLPLGATPLDFAYHIHSGLGHRCRGAKINDHIVPLTHRLKTCDRIEIITTKNGGPSRDWLNKELGYIATPRARAKVSQWFKQQDITQYIEHAKQILEREFSRAGISHPDLQKVATQFNFKNTESLLISLGHGSIRPSQIIHAILKGNEDKKASILPYKNIYPGTDTKDPSFSFQIAGIDDLLTRIAKCCKPIPGDDIIGFITQGRGISIHRVDCKNLSKLSSDHQNKTLAVNWDGGKLGAYYVDLQIFAEGREALLKEITSLLANEKIDLIMLNSTINRKSNVLFIKMTVQIHHNDELTKLIQQLKKLPNVSEVKRTTES
jgi:GTP pyrophosphokinase